MTKKLNQKNNHNLLLIYAYLRREESFLKNTEEAKKHSWATLSS